MQSCIGSTATYQAGCIPAEELQGVGQHRVRRLCCCWHRAWPRAQQGKDWAPETAHARPTQQHSTCCHWPVEPWTLQGSKQQEGQGSRQFVHRLNAQGVMRSGQETWGAQQLKGWADWGVCVDMP
jgi:hypothetical protein